MTVLHQRASIWYEQNGFTPDAIRHALSAQDFPRAASLIEQGSPEMSRSRQEATLLVWLKALPEALVRDRHVLCNLYAGALLQIGEMEGVETWLLAAERWLDMERYLNEQSGMVVADRTELHRLPFAVAMHRAGQALLLGKLDETIRHARRVLDLAPEDHLTCLRLFCIYQEAVYNIIRYSEDRHIWVTLHI